MPRNQRISKISFAERDRSVKDLYEHFISLENVDHETNGCNESKANGHKHTNILCQQSSFIWYRTMCAICAICAQTIIQLLLCLMLSISGAWASYKTVAIANSGDNDALIIRKIELHAITFDRFVYAYAHKTIVNLLFDRFFVCVFRHSKLISAWMCNARHKNGHIKKQT